MTDVDRDQEFIDARERGARDLRRAARAARMYGISAQEVADLAAAGSSDVEHMRVVASAAERVTLLGLVAPTGEDMPAPTRHLTAVEELGGTRVGEFFVPDVTSVVRGQEAA